jgi:beta-glucanase (GH16 family)
MRNLSRLQRSGNFRSREGADHSTPARLLSIVGMGRALLFAVAALLVLAGTANAQNWTLVWSDEFNGPAGPFTPTSSNNQFWTFETGQGVFGTGEIEDMISDGTTSYLDGNGHLVIKTYKSGSTYFSARIKTQLNGAFGKEFQYGRLEASIQIPTSQAIWPAFWMMGDNGVTWPGRGEIDIMENNGAKPTQIRGTIHGIGYANTGLGAHFDSTTPFFQGYRTYGVIWSPYLIQFYVDDPSNIYATYTPGEIMGVGSDPSNGASTLGQWDFWGHPFFILFDVAVGGGFVGPPGSGTVVPQFMNIDYVRVYQATPSPAPTSLTATAASNSQVQLSWSPSVTSDPNVTYNIFRSTTSGTEHSISNTNMTNMISTGVKGTSFTDVLVTPGATYYYEVTATDQESGESPLSNEAVVKLPSAGTTVQAIAISSGSLVGTENFVQDTGFNLGATNAYPDVIDVSKVTNPAPQGVYRTERWGPTTYTIPNLTPGDSYTVRLHFAETAFAAAGQRAFNVAVNGAPALTNFDIFVAAGGEFIANVQELKVTADSSGTITIAFTAGTNGAPHTNPSLRGIEIIPAVSSQDFTISATPGSQTVVPGGTTSYTVTATPQNGFTGTVALSASGLPSGASASFNPTSLSGSSSSTLTVTTAASTPSGSDTLSVTGTSGSLSHSANVVLTVSATAPQPPSNLAATAASSSAINLTWTASPTSGVTYDVFRSTTSGFIPSSSNEIGSRGTSTSFADSGLACNTTYFYVVEAANAGGTSAASNQASATTQSCVSSVLQINAGGPAVTPFLADKDFTGGTTIHHANTIDLSGVTNPAPMAVYQTARVGNFTYTLPGFTAGSSHTVRLHFAETYFSTAGSRKFNVSINGTQVLSAFDIFAAAGAKNKAIVEQFTVKANASGQFIVQFTSVVNQSLLSGVEVQ